MIPDPIITINGFPLKKSQITNYKVTYNKLWKNANRNMNGTVEANLIGVYPNIAITTIFLDFGIAQQLSAAVNQDYFHVSYWDTQTGSMKSAQYYAADHEVEAINECKYGQVTIELVAVEKSNYI